MLCMEREITITLSDEEARHVQERVDAGEYASVSDVVKAALQHYMLEDDPSWIPSDEVLRELVQEAIDDPRPSLTPDEVREQLRAHHERRIATLNTERAR